MESVQGPAELTGEKSLCQGRKVEKKEKGKRGRPVIEKGKVLKKRRGNKKKRPENEGGTLEKGPAARPRTKGKEKGLAETSETG